MKGTVANFPGIQFRFPFPGAGWSASNERMETLLALFALALQDDSFRIEGPPFLAYHESVELRAVNFLPEAVLQWRIADGPLGAVDTAPTIDVSTRKTGGVDRLTIWSVGESETELRFVVTQERRGIRLAKTEFRLRIGPLVRVRARCRVVENAKGGTRRPDEVRDEAARRELETGVNRLLRPLGVEAALEAGKPVTAPDAWFDVEGRFHPIGLKDGKKANSATLNELLKNDEPGGFNVYFVRDCNWVTVQEGFPRIKTDHHLLGVGLKEGQVVLDDGWDAPSLAHELGHALGLDDLGAKAERGRLMYSVRRDRTGLAFVYGEMKDARERARQHLKSWLARR